MATCAAVVCAEDAAVETTADVSASVQANVASTYTGYQTLDGVTYYIAAGQVYSSNKVFNNGSMPDLRQNFGKRTM